MIKSMGNPQKSLDEFSEDDAGNTMNIHGGIPFEDELEVASKRDTAILSQNNIKRRPVHARSFEGTSVIGKERELLLIIRGIVERLTFTDELSVTLGRSDIAVRHMPDIDLTPYGAADRGVSRDHAHLHTENDHVYITDLGSTNGTFLAGERLKPQTPTLLRKGDELLLGRLAIQVMFT